VPVIVVSMTVLPVSGCLATGTAQMYVPSPHGPVTQITHRNAWDGFAAL
jgi:hypothetical protein